MNTRSLRETYLSEVFFLTCILVLLLNDHVWKGLYGNLITGKLSDVVGPFVLYRFLQFVPTTPRAWHQISVIVTIVFSVTLKLYQPWADWVAAVSCGTLFNSTNCQVLADPYDLLAFIPFLLYLFVRCRHPKKPVFWSILINQKR